MVIIRDKEIIVGYGLFGVVYKGILENKMYVVVKILVVIFK